MSEAVRDILIKPMLELFTPPQHLRNDHHSRLRALAVYEAALSRFDRPTLQRAWEQVVANQTDWTWPSPGILVRACLRCEVQPTPPFQEKNRRPYAMAMADAYTAHYMKTSYVAKLAKTEGWGGRLCDYIQSAAWVQAQLIAGVQPIGWDCCLIPDWDRHESVADAFAAYCQTIAKPVERGQIRVTVPKDRIQDWKERCQGAERLTDRHCR